MKREPSSARPSDLPTRDMDQILAAIRAPLADVGYVDLEIPPRDGMAEPPDFSEDADRTS